MVYRMWSILFEGLVASWRSDLELKIIIRFDLRTEMDIQNFNDGIHVFQNRV